MIVTMESMIRSLRFLVLVAWLAAAPAVLHGQTQYGAEQSSEDGVQFVRGIITVVSAQDMQLGVRQVKGETLFISIGPDTELVGVNQVDELEKRQQVKVWYIEKGGRKEAVKIEKMMELGC